MSARRGGSCRNVHFFLLMVFRSNLQLSTCKSIFPYLLRVQRLDGDMQGQRPGGLGIWSSQTDLQTSKQLEQLGSGARFSPDFYLFWAGQGLTFFKNYLKSLKNLENFRGKQSDFLAFLKNTGIPQLPLPGNTWLGQRWLLPGRASLTSLSHFTHTCACLASAIYLPGLSLTDTWKKNRRHSGI